jgi:outer membrane protein OmpA-like peptidoglycan-associated protein
MGIKKLLLASAAIAVLASPATARDRSGWYVGLGAGVSIVEDYNPAGTINDIDLDNGYGVYGSVGYAFSRHWRVEGEIGYRENDAFLPGFAPASASLAELTFMGNIAYDLPITNSLAWTLLAGAGMDRATLERGVADARDTEFAWQLGTELTYQASDHWDLYLGYRYLNASDQHFSRDALGIGVPPQALDHDYNKHLISLGLRYGYKAPPAPPAPVAPAAPPPPPPIKQFIVFFGFNKYNLTAEAQAVVAEAASAAKSQGAASIMVVGHTDTVGGNAYNQKLSEKRAGAVKDELVRLGIDAGKISASGKGETELLVQTGDGVKEPQNRRATIDLK